MFSSAARVNASIAHHCDVSAYSCYSDAFAWQGRTFFNPVYKRSVVNPRPAGPPSFLRIGGGGDEGSVALVCSNRRWIERHRKKCWIAPDEPETTIISVIFRAS